MSKKNPGVRAQLLTAQKKKLIVRFSRPFESGTFTGYVIDIGPKFFLLASLNESLELENYTCLRTKDVRRLQCPAKYAEFYRAVRAKRGDKMPRKIKLDLTDSSSILESASPSLVTIHREKHSPDTCNIGYGISADKTTFEMIEIGPDAQWDSKPGYFRFKQITRIDLPGPYERALLLVGGFPDALLKKEL